MVITQGEIWWAELGILRGSAPGFRRPIIILQSDALNRTGIATLICVPLTSNLRWAIAAGNVLVESAITGLPSDSVANLSQIFTIDRRGLIERVGKLSRAKLDLIFAGLDIILGR